MICAYRLKRLSLFLATIFASVILAGGPRTAFGQLSSNVSGFGSGLTSSGSSRFSSGSGTGLSSGTSGLSTSSGQFMDLGNVNTAAQMLGTTNNQSFVGADSSDISNVMSMLQGNTARGTSRTGTTGISSFGNSSRGLGGLTGSRSRTSNRNLTGRSRVGRNQQDPIRIALRVGFEVPQRAIEAGTGASAVTVSATRSFTSAASRIAGAAVEISIQGRTAVLRGTVPSAGDRLVAERLALLEPGIERVENQLTVAAPTR